MFHLAVANWRSELRLNIAHFWLFKKYITCFVTLIRIRKGSCQLMTENLPFWDRLRIQWIKNSVSVHGSFVSFKVKRAHLIEYGGLWPWIQACHWDLGGMTTSLSLILLICAARVIVLLLSQRINTNTWWGCVYVGNTAGRLPRQLFQFFPSGCCWTCAPHVPLPLGNSEPTISLASNLPSSVHHSGTYY